MIRAAFVHFASEEDREQATMAFRNTQVLGSTVDIVPVRPPRYQQLTRFLRLLCSKPAHGGWGVVAAEPVHPTCVCDVYCVLHKCTRVVLSCHTRAITLLPNSDDSPMRTCYAADPQGQRSNGFRTQRQR